MLKQSILTKNIVKFSQNSVAALSNVPPNPRHGPAAREDAGGGGGWLQQAQGVAVITGIPEQRMQINTVMNFYLQQFDTLVDDTSKQNCDKKRNRKQYRYRVRKF